MLMTTVEPVAAARQTTTARLRLRNAAAAIEFYKKAFGAREVMRFAGAGGDIAHAEIAIGNSVLLISEEVVAQGYPSPQSLGGSPVSLQVYVDDADAMVKDAVAAGARLVAPVADHFYGDRSGQLSDPFGYSWTVATRKEDLSPEEMQRRFEGEAQREHRTSHGFVPKGFHTVTPFLLVKDAPGLIEFVKQVFGADETFRTMASDDGMEAEVRIGESRLRIGGGSTEAGPGCGWSGESRPTALHVYVLDTDAAYQRAMKAGAISLQAPNDHDYGERGASVQDPHGNLWYIATHLGERYTPEGLRTVTPYLQPLRSEPLINFLRYAFGAEESARHASPDGVIFYAHMRIGDSSIEMADAHGLYQPMPTTFYLYLPNVDAAYRRALEIGAISTAEPHDQPYGDRNAGVRDVFGNQWHMAMRLKESPV